jgi:hypothetical protein
MAARMNRACARADQGHPRFGDLVGQKKAKDIAPEDIVVGCEAMLSVFIRDPAVPEPDQGPPDQPRSRALVENAIRDHFDHFLTDNMERGKALLGHVMERMDERLRRKAEREVKRKTATSAQAAPARQADRLQRAKDLARPNCSSLRAIWQAAARNRRATARRRRSCPFAARSSTSPAPRSTRSAPIRKSPICCWRWAAACARTATPTICAMTAS